MLWSDLGRPAQAVTYGHIEYNLIQISHALIEAVLHRGGNPKVELVLKKGMVTIGPLPG